MPLKAIPLVMAGSMGPMGTVMSGGFLASIGGLGGALSLGMGGVGALQAMNQASYEKSMLKSQAGGERVKATEAFNAGRAKALEAKQAKNVMMSDLATSIGAAGGALEGNALVAMRKAGEITDFNVATANMSARQQYLGYMSRAAALDIQGGSVHANALDPIAKGAYGAYKFRQGLA